MNLSGKGAFIGDQQLTVAKAMTLNPHAAEFIPFALRSSAGCTSTADASSKLATSGAATAGKAVLDRTESYTSNNSDEEAREYWHHQLPDDITPDFKVMEGDDIQGINNLPFSSLTLTEISEGSRLRASTGSGFVLKEQQEISLPPVNGNGYAEKTRYPVSSYGGYPSPTGFQHPLNKHWDKQIVNNDQILASFGEEPPYNGNFGHGFLGDVSNGQSLMENSELNPLEFLASQFPGFAAESLAEVYFANEGDLNLTIEMLTQLEHQVDGSLNQNLNSKALSAPNLSALDFPTLSEDESTLLFNSSSSIPSRGAIDFAPAVKKMAIQDPNIWKYDRNGSSDTSIGSSRSSQVLASSYTSGQGRGYGDRVQSRGSARAAPVWLETGEAVANMYSEIREEAHDHARLRNAYFEQARQAYIIGNKALAKELSIKGQLHNMQMMKAAHGKAQESIYRQRNPEMQANGRERIIDLQGLHVSEAIHVLKRELAVMKNAARSADERLLLYICVGTGHHTRGSRTPVRLPASVQRYLLEEEGLDYTEPQPGLLRVVIY
ncbi:CTC-interacting domain 7 [Abeliophyllum distichum]|uniref:CTC-interacting domain 7 n=1 Tax=Abeliophyllum distichum TaxID=126358 RepID=A0ABD1UMK1_9LAMI